MTIAAWFHELAHEVNPANSKITWLNKFRKKIIEEDAAIISFNWDLVIDELLFNDALDANSYGLGTDQAGSPILPKPHGSLNWFEGAAGEALKGEKRALIFGSERRKDAIFAFRGFREPKSKHGKIYNPLIIPPILHKDFEKPIFKALWKKCTSILSTASKVVFLGYSMPMFDLHAQFIMRCGFHNQVEGELTVGSNRAVATRPAEVIIVNPDRGAALRTAAVAGPEASCKWVSTPVADWVSSW